MLVNQKPIMESYIKSFNEKSEKITSEAFSEMDYQDMSWAKPISTRELYENMVKKVRDISEENKKAEQKN